MNLKFCQINAENLFLLFDSPLPTNYLKLDQAQWESLSHSIYKNKPLVKTIALAKAFLDINADLFLINEVGGLESLKNFNEYFLNNAYSPILIEGNSDRSIDVGFLIKKNSPFYFDLVSHKNKKIDLVYKKDFLPDGSIPSDLSYKLSRDCAELHLFTQSFDHPFLTVLLTHLKSPLDPEGIDHQGSLRRTAELKACIDIYNEVRQTTGGPVILAGDFNGNASRLATEKEFTYLYQNSDLEDIFHLAQVPPQERYTYIQIKSGARSEGRQIDYCFLSPDLHSKLNKTSAKVYLYKDEFNSVIQKPLFMDQRGLLPSDHYPVIFTLENLDI